MALIKEGPTHLLDPVIVDLFFLAGTTDYVCVEAQLVFFVDFDDAESAGFKSIDESVWIALLMYFTIRGF